MNLTALQHSPFLQSLGWAIANSLWQAAALWIAYHLVIGIYKNATAKFKNNLSTILLSAAFLWFCITLFNKYFAIESLSGYKIQYYDSNSIDAAASVNWEAIVQNIAGILPYLSVAYLLLLVLLTARLINVYRFTRYVRFNGLQKPGAEWKLFTEKVARQMGITKNIRLWVSHHIDVPATIGFMKPVILIPLASINQLSSDQLEAIILHELSHIKRNDYLINLFISIIETILFFNPFIVLLSRIIKRERENCCDDFVIQYQYDRHAYASALLSLEQFRNINLRLAIGATSGKKQLLVRIKRIMEVSGNTNFNYGQKLVALLLITGVICSVAWLSPQNNENKKMPVTKSNDKNFDKLKKIEKANVLVLSQNDTKSTKTIQKPQLKKGFLKTEPELKELRNLNLNELAALQYKRVNQLLQESKKEISRKKLPKFNINKLLFAKGTTPPVTIFTNGTAFSPVKVSSGASALKHQYAYGFDIQKFQADWDRAHHSYSFDSEQMQNAVKQALNSKEVKRLLSLNHTIKQSDIEKMLTEEFYIAAEKNYRTLLNQAPRVFSAAHTQSLYFADSVINNENKIRTERTRKPVRERTNSNTESTPVPDVRTSYTYGFGNDMAINEGKVRNAAGGTARSILNERPVTHAGAHGYTYTVTTPANCPVIVPASKQKTSSKEKESIRVEYRNGIILINDKEIRLADTDKVIARTSPRLRKISVVEQQLINERIND